MKVEVIEMESHGSDDGGGGDTLMMEEVVEKVHEKIFLLLDSKKMQRQHIMQTDASISDSLQGELWATTSSGGCCGG